MNENNQEAPDFEKAIEASGFGMFNIFLLFAALPGLWATVFETTTMSFVVAAAECDLNLTLVDKSILNGISFSGMLLASLPWGFVADTFGRKYALVVALLMEGTITFFSIFSQTSKQLMAFKFFSGIMSSGPTAVFVSYISEFHGKKHRVYIVIVIGFINSLPLIVLPAMAMVILPSPNTFNIGTVEINSWRLFIAITALPALLSGFLIIFFPESPKFLMSQGRNDKAIKAFRQIYALNKFQKGNSYPINTLKDEAPEKKQRYSLLTSQPSLKNKRKEFALKCKEGLKTLLLVVHKSNLRITIMVASMFFFSVLSINAVRLWLPQEFATLREMEQKHVDELYTCGIMKYSLNKTHLLAETDEEEVDSVCEVFIDSVPYIDSVIVAGAVCFNFIFTAFLVKLLGNNILLRIYLGISCISLIIDYWSISRTMILVLSSIFTACGLVSKNLLINASVNLYPTTLRTMAVVFLLSCARTGSVIGNLILPYLMSVHCAGLFAFFSLCLLCTLIISFFLPNTTREALK